MQQEQPHRIAMPFSVGLLVLLALALHAPSLGWGFHYDDYFHQYLLRYAMDWPGAGPWRLYDFSFWTHAAREQAEGPLAPWWIADDFKVSFFRPITSLSLWLDYCIYDRWAPGYHLTNLGLFTLLLVLAFRLFSELGASRRAALWGLAFLACKDIQALPVGWIANRNELLATLFLVLMVHGVVRHLRQGGWHRLVAALVFFLCACLSKESGLAGLPLVGCVLLTLSPAGRPETLFGRLVRTLKSPVLWAFAGTAVIYLFVYSASGHGSISSNYATPWHRSGVYFAKLASLLPLASGSLFFGLSTDLIFTRPQLQVPICAASTVLFLVLAWLFWRNLRREPLAWLAVLWVVAAILPAAGVTLSDRLLVSASVGSSLLLGLLVDRFGSVREIRADLRRCWPAVLFVVMGFAISIPSTLLRQRMFHRMAASDRAAILGAAIPKADEPGQAVIALNSPSTLLGITFAPTWAVERDQPGLALYPMNVARRAVAFRREDERTLVMVCGEPPLLQHRYERVFHTREAPPVPGTIYSNAVFSATILEVDKRAIRSVRFVFQHDLSDPRLTFLAWQEGAYRTIELPAIGDTLDLPAPTPTVRWAP